ncbi:MAG: hypothetical protein ACO1SV_07285 [Fimbriimonas sp.]
MRTITLICRQCGQRKQVRFYEAEEARREGVPTMPINHCRCERCGSYALEMN